MWAKDESEVLSKTLGSFRQYALRGGRHIQLTLGIPFVVPPTCSSFEDITDLWAHQLHGSKWEDIITERRILLEPAEMTTTGTSGPVTKEQPFMLVTLAHEGDMNVRKVSSWRHHAATQEVGQVVIVDVLSSNLFHSSKKLQNSKLRQIIA